MERLLIMNFKKNNLCNKEDNLFERGRKLLSGQALFF